MDGSGRRQVSMPDMNYDRYSHDELKAMTDAANVGGSTEIADEWGEIAVRLQQAGAALEAAARGSTASWQGEAATLMRQRLHDVANWSSSMGNGYTELYAAITKQTEAVEYAKTVMPPKVPYEPEKMITEASGNPGLMATLPERMQLQRAQSDAAYNQAKAVVAARDSALAEAVGAVAELVPPPERVEDGGGVRPPRHRQGSGGSGSDGGAGGVTGGGSGSESGSGSGSGGGPGAPGPGPIVPAPIGPIQPNPGLTNPDRYVPGPPSGVPSLPTPGVGTGVGAPTGGPGFGAGVGFVPNTGFGGGGGGGGAGGGGVRGGGPGAGGPGRGPGGATGMAPGGAAGGPGAGTRGAAGARGGAGMGGMPLGAGRGQGGEDTEHKRPTYLEEPDPEALFGTDEVTAPPVIGDE